MFEGRGIIFFTVTDRLCSGGVRRHSQVPPASLEEVQCYGGSLFGTRFVDSRFWPPHLVSKAAVHARARCRRSGKQESWVTGTGGAGEII